ncbi:RecBCD enzyme subunit RecB [Microlunatus endophyticus]|uniref:RecBCD enzyme subunit RecB n=1 Tax=Microlunatus endophyticus TaxID=1716077 RepID=A0A917S5S2_9ACTN|nr:UvrD-helicase domain-containing protein [Microlunatus endophyticus]GGL56607.1 RecBCD enzyme subunit RecB [Microlunatus endophyticus]
MTIAPPSAVEATPFDICGPLPTGTTVLEASAGTGKTYAIAALAARYIAAGEPLSELMMITFGRMATNELRLRIRERLAAVESALSHALDRDHEDDQGTAPADEVLALLCTGDQDELRVRHQRIRAALADFDSVMIATTHEYCQRMLDELGVLGDHEPDAVFTESLTDLVHEVAADVYLRRYAAAPFEPPFPFSSDKFGEVTAVSIATEVIGSEHVPLVPVPTDDTTLSEPAERYRFATDVREQFTIRKRRRRLYSYEDMLLRLRATLKDPVTGPAAVQRLRDRYRIVLIDEFQDTDPVQWDIIRTAFVGHSTVILIGDPKQAIYAFRGADVYSYLDAVGEAGSVGTLATNWRSDGGLVDALGTLMSGVTLGDPRIAVRPVAASHTERRLIAGDALAPPGMLEPVRIRYQPYDPAAESAESVDVLRPRITDDLVADISNLLAAGPQLRVNGDGRVRPGDIAVLVRRNKRAEEIAGALIRSGIPAVVLGAGSVFASESADHWLTLLTALEQPRQQQIRAVSLTPFVGWTMPRLATADEAALTGLSATIRRWSRVLAHRGVAALVETITSDEDLSRRILSDLGGERRLTDLRHIGQSLHATATAGQLGVGALIAWLRQRIDEARTQSTEERSRRLETDDQAVQILTVHGSKGLEFPIVYLPEIWDRWCPDDDGQLLRIHQSRTDGITRTPSADDLVLDVGGLTGAGRKDRAAQDRLESGGDDLRLAYVALTRAQVQVVAWWMDSRNTPGSALQRLLFRSRDGAGELADRYPVNTDPGSLALGPGFSIEPIGDRPVTSWRAPSRAEGALRLRTFDRELDLAWRRTSYTSLTAAAHGTEVSAAGVTSEPEPAKEDDETPAAETLADATARPPVDGPVSPMDGLPMGAAFGTVVHAIFERVDPQSGDLAATLRQIAADELAHLPAQEMTPQALADGVLPAWLTPLGPLADDLRLADIPVADRLSELTFELPLAGGSTPRDRDVRLGDVGDLLARTLPGGDPLSRYPELLAQPLLADQPLRGYLNGSIDAVLRIHGVSGPRYVVVDYKTNWLGDLDQRPLRVTAYSPDRLGEAMMHAHYPLQALLYSVALHRYLRWRQPGYSPDDHLGGMLYLFVRGMAGPDTPRIDGIPCGVFSWRPPSELIIELSQLLDGAAPR